MNLQTRRFLNEALRLDLTTFIHRSFQTVGGGRRYRHNWHVEAIAYHLEQCFFGNTKRLLITLPPRHLKSISASVAFPAWVLGHDPSKRVLCASYSDVLAGELSRDCRRVMESEWYRRVFPRTRISVEKNSETHFVTTAQGHRYATSTGGSITGMGGDIIIVDDPIKSDEALSETRRTAINEWFDRTLSTRLDRPADGVIIVIMQRLALEDLAGHVLQKGNWTHLNLPAIATADKLISIGYGLVHQRTTGEVLHPQHISRERLAEKKKEMGSFHFSAQYQQDPVPAEGEIIKWSWFRFYRSPLIPQCGDQIVQSWDTAYKAKTTSDFSVCTTWLVRGNLKYLIDVLREKSTIRA